MSITYLENENIFQLDTMRSSYIIGIVDEEQFVGHVYYGKKVRQGGGSAVLLRTGEAPFMPSGNNRDRTAFLDSFAMEYAGNGLGDYRESTIGVRTKDGYAGISVTYESYEILSCLMHAGLLIQNSWGDFKGQLIHLKA